MNSGNTITTVADLFYQLQNQRRNACNLVHRFFHPVGGDGIWFISLGDVVVVVVAGSGARSKPERHCRGVATTAAGTFAGNLLDTTSQFSDVVRNTTVKNST